MIVLFVLLFVFLSRYENIFMLLNDKHTFVQEQSPGLGLSICKAIIDAVHGKIGVESTEGQGATFWFWIPCKVK